jgi:predicted dinucleotide-binding enzyme
VIAADCIIFATECADFRKIEADIITMMRGKIIIDPNGFMEALLGNMQNVQYFAVGRNSL